MRGHREWAKGHECEEMHYAARIATGYSLGHIYHGISLGAYILDFNMLTSERDNDDNMADGLIHF